MACHLRSVHAGGRRWDVEMARTNPTLGYCVDPCSRTKGIQISYVVINVELGQISAELRGIRRAPVNRQNGAHLAT